MSIVDVDGVVLQDGSELVDETHKSCFNTKNLEDLSHIVTGGFLRINV